MTKANWCCLEGCLFAQSLKVITTVLVIKVCYQLPLKLIVITVTCFINEKVANCSS